MTHRRHKHTGKIDIGMTSVGAHCALSNKQSGGQSLLETSQTTLQTSNYRTAGEFGKEFILAV